MDQQEELVLAFTQPDPLVNLPSLLLLPTQGYSPDSLQKKLTGLDMVFWKP